MFNSVVRTAALAAASTAWVVNAQGAYGNSSDLPIVDLGYTLQQATVYNTTGQFYNFSNIRYAAPPTGENRFAAPKAPAVNRTVQIGLPDRICPQADPAWLVIAEEYIPLYLAGQTVFNASSFPSSNVTSTLPAQDPRTTEDCLFLDVVVPQQIFDDAGNGTGAPVLVWIYGGGYTAGSKSDSGNPAGLLASSESGNGTGVIYVSLNYRLGAFGWLSGPTFQENGTANAGLHDQRFALEWVQANIAKFGGDPTRVTVFGESAGGGSIMHQITAYGGNNGPAPFAQAVPQSPAFQPFVSNNQLETIFDEFLALLNVSTLEEARQLPFEDLLVANIIQVGGSNYGSFTYGPTVDGDFVPALPGLLLLHGEFDKNVSLMLGHNADEGLLFTSPFNQNNSAFEATIVGDLPSVVAYPSVLEYITNTLYPPIFDGSQAVGAAIINEGTNEGYTNQIGRATAAITEISFSCNAFYLDKAFGNATYSYLFAVPPALHGEDIPYTYYNGPSSSVLSTPIALALQKYITDFAETGSPNAAGVPLFSMYGDAATIQVLNITGITEARDPAANARCDWWQKALYQ